MRFLLVALATFACGPRAPAPAPPANKAPAPDYAAVALDELAFLPADAEIVFGMNVATMRQSHLWRVFEPQLSALMKQLPGHSACGDEFTRKLVRVTLAIKMINNKQVSGVFVAEAADMDRLFECSLADTKREGGTVMVDRGVTITKSPKAPEYTGASLVVGPMHLVAQLAPTANHDTLKALLSSGTPLRRSAVFMELYNRRERGAAMWGMANGNAAFFATMGSMRPRSVDGTIVITDELSVAVRMTMPSPVEATSVESEINQIKPMAGNYVKRLDTTVTGSMLQINVAMTEAQIRALMSQLFGATGP